MGPGEIGPHRASPGPHPRVRPRPPAHGPRPPPRAPLTSPGPWAAAAAAAAAGAATTAAIATAAALGILARGHRAHRWSRRGLADSLGAWEAQGARERGDRWRQWALQRGCWPRLLQQRLCLGTSRRASEDFRPRAGCARPVLASAEPVTPAGGESAQPTGPLAHAPSRPSPASSPPTEG